MDGQSRRHRSSTAASRRSNVNTPAGAELRKLIESLGETLSDKKWPGLGTLQIQCIDLRRIRQLLVDSSDATHTKDAFRHERGFNALLDVLRSLKGFYSPSSLPGDERAEFFELLKVLLEVLSEALLEHAGNRRYFARRVENGGWAALELAIADTGAGVNVSGSPEHDPGTEQLFGCLLAFAVSEETLTRIFRDIRQAVASRNKTEGSTFVLVNADGAKSSSEETEDAQQDDLLSRLTAHVQGFLDGSETLQNPEVIPLILKLWAQLSEAKPPNPEIRPLSVAILLVLQKILMASSSNKLAFHGTQSLGIILPMIFDDDLPEVDVDILRTLAEELLAFGVNQLEDAYYLFQQAGKLDTASDLLSEGMKASRQPPFIQFDLTQRGYSSLELADLGRPFPPTTAGYTLTAWVRVDHFDEDCHTTIFGAYDASQTCFVLAYLEKGTQNFILQTSITSSKPSVRFRSTIFQAGVWYHIALVHRRPKPGGSSKAALFVNGEFAEEAKCYYPSSPPFTSENSDTFASLTSSNQKRAAVQAFLGTPQDLASRLGRNVVFSRWSLASCHLFDEALSDELVAVHQKLGPRYNGNFQDCLGSFQTYRASAELNLYNELLHPGKDEKSQIVAAIRLKASSILPESRILFSISPLSVMDDDDSNTIDESQLVKSLSKNAGKCLHLYTRAGGHAIAINAAVPSINEALTRPQGVAVLTGSPVVVVPQSLDDASWRVAGCAAVGLKLVQIARTPDAVLRSVTILFDSIAENWRNSEAMERENGFGVLAGLMREKLGFGKLFASSAPARVDSTGISTPNRADFALQLLQSILDFVGFSEASPEDSIIINPLAYRILLVDFDLWRRASPEAQKVYYQQMSHFAKSSKHHHFNAKRLNRMRMVKKLLDALKGEVFLAEVFPYFSEAFEALIRCSMSGETLRSVALFITFALYDSRSSYARTLRAKSSVMHFRSQTATPTLHPGTPASRSRSPAQDSRPAGVLSQWDLGVRVLEMYARIVCDPTSYHDIRKFAKTVTNKWLLHLLAENDARVIVSATKILARLLVVHGAGYIKKFSEKSGGFVVLKHRLRNRWNTPAVWTICFAVLFGMDVAQIDFERDFDLYNLVDTFLDKSQGVVVYPEVLPVITAMLGAGLRTVLQTSEDDEASDIDAKESGKTHSRRRSMSINAEVSANASGRPKIGEYVSVLQTVIQFLTDLHARCQGFRDFSVSSYYVQELLYVLYPVVVTSDSVSADTELNSRGSALTFEGQDVVIRPHSRSVAQDTAIIRTTVVDAPASPKMQKAVPLLRGSSFVLLSSDKSRRATPTARLNQVMSPKKTTPVKVRPSNTVVQALVEAIIAVFLDQLFQRKDFPGFGLFLKVPPGFQEHQAYFESYILRHTVSALSSAVEMDRNAVCDPKVLTNLARYSLHMAEALFEGWFLSGAEPLLDFLGNLLDYLQRSDVAKMKAVRLCTTPIGTIRTVFHRVVLLRLSELDENGTDEETVAFIEKMTYWQTIILSPKNSDEYFLKLICYMLYLKLIDTRERVRLSAANFWRMVLVQKPTETSTLLSQSLSAKHRYLSTGFMKLREIDNEAFLEWIDSHRQDLDDFFFGGISKAWEEFVATENQKTEETARNRVAKRRDKLHHWKTEEDTMEDVLHRHDNSTAHWRANIHASERLKHQRAIQDQQDNLNFIASSFEKLNRTLKSPCGLFEDDSPRKWQLDPTEGRNRMRMRLLPDRGREQEEYQPKRGQSDTTPKTKLSVDTKSQGTSPKEALGATPSGPAGAAEGSGLDLAKQQSRKQITPEPAEPDEDYEIIEDPKEDEDGFEDKNRRVMRSLQHGDQVQHVCNVSRIIGLEACEGLLILGKDSLYLLDHFFQRSDGEIVRVWQAPQEERDPYLQLISGRETNNRKPQATTVTGDQSRNWRWEEVLSISKRRFLFRDVAIETFFTDGRSYLLTVISPATRNDLFTRLISRAPQVTSPSSSLHPDDLWRLESLRNPDDAPQTLGYKFANVFTSQSLNPGTRKWMRGEISNFHYLMLANTMAGRTFNDLTQYPVFPWVLADYTSDELDLDDPKTFRDFSKPMGAQTVAREAEFRDRYQSFAEMSDENAPPFHYGTHYSSAMIVSSYLIRLQPFVQSYLLLQGGSFDHADRMFYSIEKAWLSASRDNMTDVRELTPEFFYLPEFLTNINGYNFGLKQQSSEAIDDVALPPWAKGSPEIFIAKHREALESPYVSKNLHKWIDLVFGHKQQGEAAIAATNVFHYLSYHGAKDLDNIEDPVERLATIGIIHNFGQTPHQVFQRAHSPREDTTGRWKRLDNAADSLTRLPSPLLESHERVASLIYSTRHDRLLCSAAFRLNIPPTYERYMEWGFADGSVRFYATDNRKLLGLFEHMHQGQISCAAFVDGKLLVTAGTDCTISVWTLTASSKAVDLQPRFTLFGHRSPVVVLAASRALGTFLSASRDGRVLLWDLNRAEFVRELGSGGDEAPVQSARINNITGHVMLCRDRRVLIYTLNGRLLVDQDVCGAEADAAITSCAFYEGVGNEWLEKELVFTGQKRGTVNVWNIAIDRDGKWHLELVTRLNHVDVTREGAPNYAAEISCILPMAQVVYTGDEDGRVYEWECMRQHSSGS